MGAGDVPERRGHDRDRQSVSERDADEGHVASREPIGEDRRASDEDERQGSDELGERPSG